MINSEDIDKVYEMLKILARGKSLTHTELISSATALVNTLLNGEKVSQNIIDNIVDQYEENVSIKSKR